jgi:zinc finger protein
MSEKAKETEEEFSFKCPSCKNGIITIDKSIYDSQDGDKLLILKFECNECNFSKNDIVPMATKMIPGIITLKVKNESDLRSKIYRSPTGKLEIPELELLVDPGPRADFYFTNVEGILIRFEKAVRIYKKTLEVTDPQYKEIEEILDDLSKAINGEFEFSLKITDPVGGSYIIPQEDTEYNFEDITNSTMSDEAKLKD